MRHPKFLRLVRQTGTSPVYCRGVLEVLWDVGYEAGDDRIGDADDVESIAGWTGERGALVGALLSSGGRGRSGFIDPDPEVDGHYRIHDLWDHAPSYVAERRSRELMRKKDRICAHCSVVFRSSDPRATYCGHACRTAAWRSKPKEKQPVAPPEAPPEGAGDGSVTDPSVTVTECDGSVRHRDGSVTDCDTTPSPSPSPSPITTTPVPSEQGGGEKKKKRPQQEYIDAAWALYDEVQAPRPTPGLLTRWAQEYLKGNYLRATRLLQEMAPRGYLNKGDAYVAGCFKREGSKGGDPERRKQYETVGTTWENS